MDAMDNLEYACSILNEAVRIDRTAINTLFNTRVVCRKAMAAHPTILVRNHTLGPLGVLNGVLAEKIPNSDKWRTIAAEIDQAGMITGFTLVEAART